ncbi:hypothetical protein NDU88_007972 [Pleurodeles waltl]|uniref:Uncharacterized protein n=1 Tax=Pleurodeles waltl TaxID=8319 RepID=A0AAV7RUH4_PLEWA|nr:hypothetical protein NDU88_007972 [Pleurodeles waltl]
MTPADSPVFEDPDELRSGGRQCPGALRGPIWPAGRSGSGSRARTTQLEVKRWILNLGAPSRGSREWFVRSWRCGPSTSPRVS